MKLIESAQKHASHIAIRETNRTWTYRQLLEASAHYAKCFLEVKGDATDRCIAYMVDPGFDYVAVQWGIWRSGSIAVPLCLSHPLPSLQYYIEDSGADTIVVSSAYAELLGDYAKESGISLFVLDGMPSPSKPLPLPDVDSSRAAMILYTSGTTSKPKGVVLSHLNLEAQMENLIRAWEWTEKDNVLCVLPLHHVHGIVNVVCCSLMAGASCTFIPSFSATHVFDLFLQGEINVFMAVPTIYYKLIAHWDGLTAPEQQQLKEVMQDFRLMVCGSAALPVSTMEKWEQISGHKLLERYGMTEIGMAISNPYHGERRAGYVGLPLHPVGIRLADDFYQDVQPGESGEILVKGDNVFKTYWNRQNETQKAFTDDGWFKTGDVAIVEQGYFRIIGRSSVDIIKSGGYKISALEIEEQLREHSLVRDCAVVGIPNEEWGELVVAALVADAGIDLKTLDLWLRERMPTYKTPKRYLVLEELPRNAMGKVVKNEVKIMFAKS